MFRVIYCARDARPNGCAPHLSRPSELDAGTGAPPRRPRQQIIKGQSGEPERPTGELLRRLLERFPNKFSSKDAKKEAREIMEARALMNESPADKVKRLERMLAEAKMEAQAEMMREAVIMNST